MHAVNCVAAILGSTMSMNNAVRIPYNNPLNTEYAIAAIHHALINTSCLGQEPSALAGNGIVHPSPPNRHAIHNVGTNVPSANNANVSRRPKRSDRKPPVMQQTVNTSELTRPNAAISLSVIPNVGVNTVETVRLNAIPPVGTTATNNPRKPRFVPKNTFTTSTRYPPASRKTSTAARFGAAFPSTPSRV